MFFFQSPLALCGSVVVKPAVLRRRIAPSVAWTTKRGCREGDNLPMTSYAFEFNHIQMTTDVNMVIGVLVCKLLSEALRTL